MNVHLHLSDFAHEVSRAADARIRINAFFIMCEFWYLVNEYIFQNEMCRQNVHRMDKFPEVSVYGIDEHIAKDASPSRNRRSR